MKKPISDHEFSEGLNKSIKKYLREEKHPLGSSDAYRRLKSTGRIVKVNNNEKM